MAFTFQRPENAPPLRMVLIRWIDTSSCHEGWMHRKVMLEWAEAHHFLAESCGLVVRETEDMIVIVQSWGGEDFERHDAGLKIPRINVLELHDLSITKAKA